MASHSDSHSLRVGGMNGGAFPVRGVCGCDSFFVVGEGQQWFPQYKGEKA